MGLIILTTCVCLLTLGVPVWTIVAPPSGSATDSPTKLQLTRTPKSQTVMVDKRFEFFCKAEGDGRIKVRWFFNGTKKEDELPKKGRNYKRLSNGTLRFYQVKVVDRGLYRCRAENEFKDFVFSEPALLTVHAPAEIMRRPETTMERVWDVGSTRHLVCQAAGIPLPRIEWRRDGQLIPSRVVNQSAERSDRDTSQVTLKSVLTVLVTRSANYSCTASNLPISGVQSTDMVRVKVTAVQAAGGPGNTPQSQQTCRPYTGKFCRGYFDSALVLPPATPGLATPADKALNDLDNLLEAHMADLTRADLFSERYGHDTCMKPARRIICHLAFPTCRVPEPGAGGGEADTGGDTSSTPNVTVDVQGTPLPICRESCQAVTEMFCLRQLAQIKRLKAEGALTGSLGMLGLPDCSTLPSKWDQGPTCVDSDHHDFAPEKVTDSCYVERGRWYNGTVSVTRSGHTCQSWDQVSPHAHNRSGLIYPEVQDGANFCRNPGGEEPSPWCYTTNPTIRFELCDIKPCGSDTGGEVGKSDEEGEQNLHMLIIVIGVPCVVLLVISTAVLLCLCCRRRRYSSAPGEDVDVDVEGLTVNSSYYAPTRLNPKLEALEFPRNDLLFVERIGQGAFGLVFKARVVCSNGNSRLGRGGGGMFGNKLSSSKQSLGFGDNRYKRNPFSSKGELQHIEFHDPLGKISCDSKLLNNEHFSSEHQIQGKLCQDTGGDKGEGQIVAVKMLKDDASETIQTDFEREASLMVEFEHENIVRLLGVCTIGRPLCLLFEYMSHGDLNDYLQLCSPDRCLMRPLPHPVNTESPLPTSLTPRGDSSHFLSTADHLHIARQVCSGMVYLSERGYVHRDLATRNCLVGAQLSVKISDFGLARSVHSMDYYRGSDRDAVPVRWMPPEAILYNKFSTQSDVWSFGVLLWEVFSYAFQPYYGLTHEEVIAALRAGKTLDPPEAAPPAVYSLMKSCWRTKPSARPSFSSLHKCLVSMHDEACRTKVGTDNVRL